MGQCLVFLCHPPVTRRPSTMSPWQTSCPASAAEPLLDRGACRLQASGDSTGGRAWSRMTTTTVWARRVGRPSSSAEWCTVSVPFVQDTICQDTFHKTQSVQDTICSRHISQDTNLFKTHFTMLDEPELPEHEVQEPEDEHEKGKPRHNQFKTRSVQDTICQDTFHKTQSVQDTIFLLKYTPCQLLRHQ